MDTFTIGVITSHAKLIFAANPNTLVKDLKNEALYKSNASCCEDAVLTFNGKILNDYQTLRRQNVKNGHNVYLTLAEKPQTRAVQKYCRKADFDTSSGDFVQMQRYICDQFDSNPQLICEFLNLLRKVFHKSFPSECMRNSMSSSSSNKCYLPTESSTPMSNLIHAFSEQLNRFDGIHPQGKRHRSRAASPPQKSGTECNMLKDVLNERAMQDLIQQMSENPTLLRDFMCSPEAQEMMHNMRRNFDGTFDGFQEKTSFCDSDSFQKYAGCLFNMMKQCSEPINPPSYQDLQRESKCATKNPCKMKNLDLKMKRLVKMGYTNCEDNMAALIEANGHLPCAVTILDNYY